MKRSTKLILSAMFIAMGATSCSEDKIDVASTHDEEKTITITGYYENENSRLSFNNDEKNFYWDDDDVITIWNASGQSANFPLISGGGTKAGVFCGEVSSTFNPTYVTFAKGIGETANNKTKSVSMGSINAVLYNAGLISLPDLSYSTLTKNDGNYTFSLNHKLAYVYLKNVSINSTPVDQVKVTTNTGDMSVDADGTTALSNLTSTSANVDVGTVIAVLPTEFKITTTDGKKTIVETTTLEAGSYYIVDKNIAGGGIVLSNQILYSTILNDDRRYSIYLPEDYQTSGKTYPILYLLHGSWENNDGWFRDEEYAGNLKPTTDDLLAANQTCEMIIVSVAAENSWYLDDLTTDAEHLPFCTNMKMESFFFNEFMPYIESTYPVKTSRASRAIAGYSMGGYGTAYYAFKHPDKFAFAYAMSGIYTITTSAALEELENSNCPTITSVFDTYSASQYSQLPKFVMTCGENDGLYGESTAFDTYLKNKGFTNYEFLHEAGYDHEWRFWRKCYVDLCKRLKSVF